MKVFPLPLAGLVLLVLLMGCQKPVKVLLVAGGHSFDTIEFFDLFHSLEGIDMDSVYYPEAMEMMRHGRTDHPDSSPMVGWTLSSDQSRVVYLMLGHDKLAYENPAFKQLLEQSISWLADQ